MHSVACEYSCEQELDDATSSEWKQNRSLCWKQNNNANTELKEWKSNINQVEKF